MRRRVRVQDYADVVPAAVGDGALQRAHGHRAAVRRRGHPPLRLEGLRRGLGTMVRLARTPRARPFLGGRNTRSRAKGRGAQPQRGKGRGSRGPGRGDGDLSKQYCFSFSKGFGTCAKAKPVEDDADRELGSGDADVSIR